MLACTPPPLLVVRLAADGRPWRLPRQADLSVRLLNVPLSRRPNDPGLPFSCTALPGRYLADLLQAASPLAWKGPQVVLSPAFNYPPEVLAAVRAEVADMACEPNPPDTRWWVLQDYRERVVAYVLPAGAQLPPALLHELRYLSARDAAIDAGLLEALGLGCRRRTMRLPVPDAVPDALPHFAGMESMAVRAARARCAMLQAGRRHTLAVVTHHAGDVLLTVQAIEACASGIDGIVVHRAYADVARAVGGRLPVVAIDGPMPARGQVASPAHPLNEDMLYFEQVVAPALPADSSFLFLRPSRGYIDADYTLAAQLAYTVGNLGDEARYLQGATLVAPNPAELAAGHYPLPVVRGPRVLLHFDGGWPLKVYPPEWQHELVTLLRAAGFQPSVLGAGVPGVPSHQFEGLASFQALLQQHDLLIGMDSFPCHYASQRLNMPTMCLFASTRITNLAHQAPGYLAMSQGLSCSPCGARLVCPRYGGTACHNFVPPAIVAELAEHSLQQSLQES